MSTTRTGLEGFNESADTPKRVLTQGLTKIKGMDDVRKGIFVDLNEKREIGKTIDVVLLDAKTKRKLFYEQGSGQRGVRCWSDDGIAPSPAIDNPVSPSCRGCQYERSDKIAEMLCLDVNETKTNGQPVTFVIEAKKTAIKPVSNYVQTIRNRGKNARDFVATLTATKQSNDKGEWFVPEFTNVRQVPNDVAQIAEEEFQRLVSGGNEDPGLDDPDNVPF